MNSFIKLKNLSKKYEKNKTIKVLNDISFNFEPGKTYSITGPSGSGKSFSKSCFLSFSQENW